MMNMHWTVIYLQKKILLKMFRIFSLPVSLANENVVWVFCSQESVVVQDLDGRHPIGRIISRDLFKASLHRLVLKQSDRSEKVADLQNKILILVKKIINYHIQRQDRILGNFAKRRYVQWIVGTLSLSYICNTNKHSLKFWEVAL